MRAAEGGGGGGLGRSLEGLLSVAIHGRIYDQGGGSCIIINMQINSEDGTGSTGSKIADLQAHKCG